MQDRQRGSLETKQPQQRFDASIFLTTVGEGRTVKNCRKNRKIFDRGDPADALFYIQEGKIKLTVLSKRGKEAVVALLGPGDIFGEGCLAGQQKRMSTATAMSACSIMQLEKEAVVRALHANWVSSTTTVGCKFIVRS